MQLTSRVSARHGRALHCIKHRNDFQRWISEREVDTQVMNIPLLTEFRTLYLVLLIMYVSVCLRVHFVADFLHIECYCIYSLLLSTRAASTASFIDYVMKIQNVHAFDVLKIDCPQWLCFTNFVCLPVNEWKLTIMNIFYWHTMVPTTWRKDAKWGFKTSFLCLPNYTR